MTEYGAPFDGILTGDATVAPYSAAEWSRIWKLLQGLGSSFPNYGVFEGSGDGAHQPLEVNATAVVSSNVEVQIGAAMVDGRFYETTAVVTLAIGANASGNPRVDTVILRLDYLAQTIRLAVKQGTPAGSPVAPTMQQDATYWEIPIANIAVANGFVTLAQSTITQRQRKVHSATAGWQPICYPVNYVWNFSNLGVGGSEQLAANGQCFLIPFAVVGNMLLEQVDAWVTTTNSAYNLGWDLYIQDVNDGNTAENTIRRVAQSVANATGTNPVSSGIVRVVSALNPTPIGPGLYWLAYQNRHAANVIDIGAYGGGTGFDTTNPISAFRKTTTNPNGATLDAVTGWTARGFTYNIRLRGRVFGQTTVP